MMATWLVIEAVVFAVLLVLNQIRLNRRERQRNTDRVMAYWVSQLNKGDK